MLKIDKITVLSALHHVGVTDVRRRRPDGSDCAVTYLIPFGISGLLICKNWVLGSFIECISSIYIIFSGMHN